MTASLYFSCRMCGTATQNQARHCVACGHPMQVGVQDLALPSLLAGSPSALLARSYRLRALLGKGGFGAVYLAEDLQHADLLVALKQINLKGLSPQQAIEATDTFNREVSLLSGLAHPNLPHIHQHFADAEHWYLVMDFINGETLEDYRGHVTGGHLPLEEVLTIGIQLANVLAYLHAQQPPIIFRDVKPANVMRTAGGHVYLIDFGIARRFRPGQRRDTVVLGSPGYAPPEQYGSAQTTERSDIYSLGATLRCLLTGEDPEEATLGKVLPAGRDQEAVAALQRLLGQMLAQDADQRPASMQAVKKALRRIQVLQSLAKRGISRRTAIIGLASLVGLATVGGGLTLSAFIHDLQDPHLLYTYSGHSNGISSVAWSPTGRRVASGSWDKTVQVWDATSGGNVLTYQGHSLNVNGVTWSPNGKHIASGSDDGTVQVWDAATGRKILTYQGHSAPVNAAVWSPNRTRIASASNDSTVQVWDAFTGGHVLTYRGHSYAAYAVAWSPDGRCIASGSVDNTVQVWDAATGRKILTYHCYSADPVNAVAWSPDSRFIASGGDQTVQVWDAADGSNVIAYQGHLNSDPFVIVSAVAWSPDGKRIASGSWDKTVQVWDAFTGRHVFTYRGHFDHVEAVAWSPDGRRIASGSDDNTVQVWSAV